MSVPGRRRAAVIVVVVVVMTLLAELGVRARADAIPEPTRWSSPELQFKEWQINALRKRGGASVVFAGSSVVDGGVDPSLIPGGRRPTYNAAVGGGSLEMIDTWTRLLAVPRLRPDVVVLGLISRELNPNDPEQQRLERDFEASPAVKHLRGNEGRLERAERRLEDWSRLVRYRTEIRRPRSFARLLGFGDGPRRDAYKAVVSPGGQHERFVNLSYTRDPRVAQRFRDTALHDYEIGARELATLRRLLTFLRQGSRRVVVVNMPVTSTYVRLHPHGQADYDEFVRVLQHEAAAAGATFVSPGIWPEALFADPAHLNGRGAKQLSEMLRIESK